MSTRSPVWCPIRRCTARPLAHSEGAAVAVEVVAAGGGAEHRGGGGVLVVQDVRLGHGVAVAGDGVPDEETRAPVQQVEEDAAVAAVEGHRAAEEPAVGPGMGEGGDCGGGDEAGDGGACDEVQPVEEAEQGRRPVEGAVAAEEGSKTMLSPL
ncbi:hypothetical protein GQ55_2G017200 [Panicum hallii var. hallii]|uniref:Uncharacterized protein n=1 Tax=Panicum hallii var. hallii TaxID=1504633 RepID=A0A2T7EKG6_9POAL|nr:hypothetical protein GQ55_2G017200 [Panicum hallii var. hallii]